MACRMAPEEGTAGSLIADADKQAAKKRAIYRLVEGVKNENQVRETNKNAACPPAVDLLRTIGGPNIGENKMLGYVSTIFGLAAVDLQVSGTGVEGRFFCEFQMITEEMLEQTVPLQNTEHLIQEMDLTRLKAVVYRDVVT